MVAATATGVATKGGWLAAVRTYGVTAANVDDLLLSCAGATAADTGQTGDTSAATAATAAMSAVGESQSLLPVKTPCVA